MRKHVRAWLDGHTPRGWHVELATATPAEFRAFNLRMTALLRQAGLLATHWPVRFGGGGFSFREQLVIQDEMVRADFPQPRLLEIALQHIAATLMAHGDDDQQRHLAAILDGEIWCQGFSEPEAGSDLASLRTKAVRQGDDYVINGQKVWSSYADHASWCLLLARTDPDAPKHRGISMFMLPLDSPGVELRPIRQATGTEEFSEIFLTDVRIPATYRVGDENAGWRMAQTTLATERAAQILELHAHLAVALDRVAAESCSTPSPGGASADDRSGGVLADDRAFRQELAARAAEIDVLGLLGERLVESIESSGEIGPDGSIVKLFYSETLQRLTGMALRMRGMNATIDEPRAFATTWTSGRWFIDHLKSWNWTIAAGSNEIQRNIVGERVLGLPREPGDMTVDEDVLREFRGSARSVIERAADRRRFADPWEAEPTDEPLWSQAVELGWTGLLVDERHGGAGAGVEAALVVVEELSRRVSTVPYLSSAVLGASALAIAGSPDQQQRGLPAIAAGEHRWTVALSGPDGRVAAGTPAGGRGRPWRVGAAWPVRVRARRQRGRLRRGRGPRRRQPSAHVRDRA